jgi:hypothetical protein
MSECDVELPFNVKWGPDGVYTLYFRTRPLADGKLPSEILYPMVDHMNYGYLMGLEDADDSGHS